MDKRFLWNEVLLRPFLSLGDVPAVHPFTMPIIHGAVFIHRCIMKVRHPNRNPNLNPKLNPKLKPNLNPKLKPNLNPKLKPNLNPKLKPDSDLNSSFCHKSDKYLTI